MSALVLDGHLKSALACVRSLGAKGIVVSCGAERRSAMSCHSKYARNSFVYTSPKKNQKVFVADVIKEAMQIRAKTGEKPVVFCLSDATFLSLVRAYETLKEYIIIPLPEFSSIEIASDKKATYELAQTLGIPTIKTFGVSALEGLTYPAIVKHAHSIVWNQSGSHSGSASFVFSQEELLNQYESVLQETGEAPLLQEFIQGDEYGIELLCNKGEVLLSFAHKRIRSLSPRGGAAVVKETAPHSESVGLMQKYAQMLVSALSWTGPVMVEFKIDNNDGRVLLMEINGRFWGSLPLAVKAGCDFPFLTYKLAHGETVKPEAFSPAIVRTRHFLGDCAWLMRVMFAHDPLRSTLYPSVLRALWDFKTEIFRSEGDIFRIKDLKPSIFEYIDILHTWKSKA